MFLNKIKDFLASKWGAQHSKVTFIYSIPRNGRVLDVGCGNNSPEFLKSLRPDIYYVGIDVGDYNQASNPSLFADEYELTSPESFSDKIDEYKGQMDAVISSHNLEHCNDQDAVLSSMLNALKPGGKLYLSFPCEESVNFPRRGGCLNFFDDGSHNQVPCWNSVLQVIEKAGCRIDYIAKRYRPLGPALKGLLYEPLSIWRRYIITDGSTWALYGFESIIWAAAASAEVILGDWGPRETTKGQACNVQEGGVSAMWIQVEGLSRYGNVWVEIGNQRPNFPAFVLEKHLTTAIPDQVIGSQGSHAIVIVESTGRRTKVGEFFVKA